MTRTILFLDFDGGLHPSGMQASKEPFTRLPLLEAMLREPRCAALEMLVSSTWREAYSQPRLRSVFAPDMRERVVDITPTLDDYDGPHARYLEIRAWLDQRRDQGSRAAPRVRQRSRQAAGRQACGGFTCRELQTA